MNEQRIYGTDFFIERIDEYDRDHYGYYILEMVGSGNCIFNFALLDYLLHEIQKLQEEKGISKTKHKKEEYTWQIMTHGIGKSRGARGKAPGYTISR